MVAPSDHVMPDTFAFHAAVKLGLEQVSNGKIVVFGISPTRPETGYGYLELTREELDTSGTSRVLRF